MTVNVTDSVWRMLRICLVIFATASKASANKNIDVMPLERQCATLSEAIKSCVVASELHCFQECLATVSCCIVAVNPATLGGIECLLFGAATTETDDCVNQDIWQFYKVQKECKRKSTSASILDSRIENKEVRNINAAKECFSYSFSASSGPGYVQIQNLSVSKDLREFTVAFWFKLSKINNDSDTTMFSYSSKFSKICEDIVIKITEYGFLVTIIGTEFSVPFSPVHIPNSYTHLAITWVGVTGFIKFYVNGSLLKSGKVKEMQGCILEGFGALVLGTHQVPKMPYLIEDALCDVSERCSNFQGEVSQVFMWGRALSGSDLLAVMNFDVPLQNCILDWNSHLGKIVGNVTKLPSNQCSID